ncbi:hypothetical protein O3S80_07065 [Streptomyces sp. Lzd4kr]|nr:hypothetical protein [Streptomyces sp. Lzd4kr]
MQSFGHVKRSADLMTAALSDRPEHQQRSRAFDHLGLARTHLAGGEAEGALLETELGLGMLGMVKSLRVADRLGELHAEAQPYARSRPGSELRERIHNQLTVVG